MAKDTKIEKSTSKSSGPDAVIPMSRDIYSDFKHEEYHAELSNIKVTFDSSAISRGYYHSLASTTLNLPLFYSSEIMALTKLKTIYGEALPTIPEILDKIKKGIEANVRPWKQISDLFNEHVPDTREGKKKGDVIAVQPDHLALAKVVTQSFERLLRDRIMPLASAESIEFDMSEGEWQDDITMDHVLDIINSISSFSNLYRNAMSGEDIIDGVKEILTNDSSGLTRLLYNVYVKRRYANPSTFPVPATNLLTYVDLQGDFITAVREREVDLQNFDFNFFDAVEVMERLSNRFIYGLADSDDMSTSELFSAIKANTHLFNTLADLIPMSGMPALNNPDKTKSATASNIEKMLRMVTKRWYVSIWLDNKGTGKDRPDFIRPEDAAALHYYNLGQRIARDLSDLVKQIYSNTLILFEHTSEPLKQKSYSYFLGYNSAATTVNIFSRFAEKDSLTIFTRLTERYTKRGQTPKLTLSEYLDSLMTTTGLFNPVFTRLDSQAPMLITGIDSILRREDWIPELTTGMRYKTIRLALNKNKSNVYTDTVDEPQDIRPYRTWPHRALALQSGESHFDHVVLSLAYLNPVPFEPSYADILAYMASFYMAPFTGTRVPEVKDSADFNSGLINTITQDHLYELIKNLKIDYQLFAPTEIDKILQFYELTGIDTFKESFSEAIKEILKKEGNVEHIWVARVTEDIFVDKINFVVDTTHKAKNYTPLFSGLNAFGSYFMTQNNARMVSRDRFFPVNMEYSMSKHPGSAGPTLRPFLIKEPNVTKSKDYKTKKPGAPADKELEE